jgi:hypothetical protein
VPHNPSRVWNSSSNGSCSTPNHSSSKKTVLMLSIVIRYQWEPQFRWVVIVEHQRIHACAVSTSFFSQVGSCGLLWGTLYPPFWFLSTILFVTPKWLHYIVRPKEAPEFVVHGYNNKWIQQAWQLPQWTRTVRISFMKQWALWSLHYRAEWSKWSNALGVWISYTNNLTIIFLVQLLHWNLLLTPKVFWWFQSSKLPQNSPS